MSCRDFILFLKFLNSGYQSFFTSSYRVTIPVCSKNHTDKKNIKKQDNKAEYYLREILQKRQEAKRHFQSKRLLHSIIQTNSKIDPFINKYTQNGFYTFLR